MTLLTDLAADALRWATAWPEWATLHHDGYPTTASGADTGSGHATGGISRPTETAVLARHRQVANIDAGQRAATNTWALIADMLDAASRPLTLTPTTDTVRTLTRIHLGADLLARLTPATHVTTSDADGLVTMPWAEALDVLASLHRRLTQTMPPLRTDTAAESRLARCVDPVCDRHAVRAGRCWQHYRDLLEQERHSA